MALRPTLLPRALRALPSARAISTSGLRRASHEDHGHHSEDGGSSSGSESMFTPAMRNSIILITASVLAWPYLPRPHKGSASPSASPEAFSQAGDAKAPVITQWLAKNTPDSKLWTERNDKHLEMTKEAAEERLLFQEAERPRVLRLKNTGAFEAASPHSIPVGSQIDLSDLKVNGE